MIYSTYFYEHFLAGQSSEENIRRREFVLNTLLCGLTIAGFIGLLAAIILNRLGDGGYRGNTIHDLVYTTLISFSLWRLARSRYHPLAAYAFLGYVAAAAGYLALTWSFELPTVSLITALLIIVTGMILHKRAALFVTCSLIASLLLVGHSQVSGVLHPRTGWLGQPLARADCFDYTLLLSLIGLVSYLANAEIDRSLERARSSQHLNATLLHDLANPLTAASLHVEIFGHQPPKALKKVKKNLHQIEGCVKAARQQLQTESYSQSPKFPANNRSRCVNTSCANFHE